MLRFLALAAGLGLLGGCGGDAASAPDDVVYEGGTSDEAWISFDEAEPIVDDARAPLLEAPVSPVSRATPATFSWTPGAVAEAPRRGVRFREELLALLIGPTAHAHGDPYTGPIYRVVIHVPGADPVRVLTGMTTYTPSAPIWERIRAATGPIEVEIAGAYARLNRIEEGPFLRAMPAEVTLE